MTAVALAPELVRSSRRTLGENRWVATVTDWHANDPGRRGLSQLAIGERLTVGLSR